MESNIGKKVIIRGNRSGVEFGTLVAQNGSEVTLENARRIWYWSGAASLSQLAKDGTANPCNCKFTVTVTTGNVAHKKAAIKGFAGRAKEFLIKHT